jgi:hypothetical protein
LSSPEFIEGQLVKWYERYADGDLTKDIGVGVLLSIKKHTYDSFTGQRYEYTNFEVYRNKFNDIITLSENDIESL